MPEDSPKIPHCYSVVVRRQGRDSTWMWEIVRTPNLGVRLYRENFRSAHAAKLSGEEALRGFLESVTKEAPDA
jgi:hypothetical protein